MAFISESVVLKQMRSAIQALIWDGRSVPCVIGAIELDQAGNLMYHKPPVVYITDADTIHAIPGNGPNNSCTNWGTMAFQVAVVISRYRQNPADGVFEACDKLAEAIGAIHSLSTPIEVVGITRQGTAYPGWVTEDGEQTATLLMKAVQISYKVNLYTA
ncbi:MAG: hypothetical protein U9Q07_00445 [Planctomycetota bacterium]|nr:hypothetical protein [Planctomycetota bacterium]